MKIILRTLVSIVMIITMATPAMAAQPGTASQPCYRFEGSEHFAVPFPFFSYLKEGPRAITVDSLKKKPDAFSFVSFSSPVPLIGFSSRAVWIRFKAENPGRTPVRAYLNLANAAVDEVLFYHVRPDTLVACTTGTLLPFHRRDVEDRDFIFHCIFPSGSASTVYLRCKTHSALEFPVSIVDEESFFKTLRTDHLASGFIFGILGFFGVAALILSLIYRDVNFRNFAVFILHFCVLIAILDGFLYMYLWPESPMMQNAARSYFFAVSFIWGIIFTVHFLKTDQFYPRVSTLGYALVTLWAGALFFSFIGNPRIAGLLLNFLALVTIVYGSFIAVLTFRHHDWASRFCFFTWFGFFLLIAGRIVIFNLDVPVAPAVVKIFHVGYRYHIAILVVIIQMLIAISYRLRLIEKERHSSQLETEALKRKTLELKLSALQARVQPHFLFNTLNTIANSVIVDPPRAERALVELSDFYRLTLRYASRGITRLCEEVDLVTRYLTLEKMKIGDRLDFSFSIDECSRQITLPSMSLQILVENSLKHGIHPKVDGGSIRVSAAVNGERCSIVVDDTGVGFRQQKSDSGTGIANLRSRLDLVYHGDYALRITDKRTSNPGETGVTAVVEIPLRPLMKNIPEAL